MTRSVKRVARAAMSAEMKARRTADSFQNFDTDLGIGTNNQNTNSTYGFNPVTRNRQLLEWAYRGSWIVRQAVDCVAEDMTRAGIDITSEMDPGAQEDLLEAMTSFRIWDHLCSTVKWSRLYGGALAVMLIDGQDSKTPLRLDTIGKGMFKGLLVLDRWMVQPSLGDLVTDLGPDLGLPKFYDVTADAPALPRMRIHHSRVLRIDGIELPYWQKITENLWSLSVIEPLFDRLVAFDSATTGAAQLVYKAHLRTIKIDGLRDIIAAGGPAYAGLLANIKTIRQFQSNEGITLLDKDDELQVNQYAFTGLSDLILQFGQQISGSLNIPLVRLFGQSPVGLNSTGESDWRNYYDGVNTQQENRLRHPVNRVVRAVAQSKGIKLPPGFNFKFTTLWQMKEEEKATVAGTVTTSVLQAEQQGLVKPSTALKELKQSSHVTGLWSNITDEEIAQADDAAEEPPAPDLMNQPPLPFSGGTQDHLSAIDVQGIPVVIECPKGTRREGKGWSIIMPAHYGYIRGTSSQEGAHEQMDAFVGPYLDSDQVFIVYQNKPDGTFDEHKVMLGYYRLNEALADYLDAYHDHSGQRIRKVEPMTIGSFKSWLENWKYGVE